MTASSKHYGVPAALSYTVAATALRTGWLAAAITVFTLVFSHNSALAWQLDVDGAVKCPAEQFSSDADYAQAVTLDEGGNIFAGGGLATWITEDEFGCYSINGFAVVKAGPLGNKLWQFVIGDAERERSGTVNAVAADGSGAVVAAGLIGDRYNNYFAVVKLDPSGNEIWEQLIAGTGHAGTAYAVAIDSQGDIVAAGSLWNTSQDFFVIKWDTNGNELWQAVIDGGGISTKRRQSRLIPWTML